MRWTLETGDGLKAKSASLILGVREGSGFEGWPRFKALGRAAEQVRFKGGIGESFFAFDTAGTPQKHLLVVGLGKELSPSACRSAAALAVRKLRERYLTTTAFSFPLPAGGADLLACVQAIVEGASLASGRFQRYLTDPKARFEGLDAAAVLVSKRTSGLEEAVERGRVIADAVGYARNLVSEPANVMTPDRMAQEARKLAKETGFKLKVYGLKECEKMGMGAFLAVGRGSRNQPRFIHFSYRPKGAKFHLGLVGKGLTFDSGGISIKPADGMGAMKGDMAGSAAVMGTLKALGVLKPKVAVDAVMAMAENMPGGDAYRPGDILRSLSGKTIEVLNTDAEGRLTLADALTFVQRQKVDAVIDLATLTGACMVALGPDFCGAMGNDQPLLDSVLAAARESGDEVWQLPLPPSYKKYISTPVADVANMSKIRWGGAITAGLFLKEFVEEGRPWAHLDIAGPALREEDSSDANKAEGSGVGVRTLLNFILAKA